MRPWQRIAIIVAALVVVAGGISAAVVATGTSTTTSTTTTAPGGSWPSSGTAVCATSTLQSPYNSGNQSTALGTTSNVVVVGSGTPGLISASLNTANTTYYFAPGTWTVGTGPYNQIVMGSNDWYVGEYSGGTFATLSGQGDNTYGFTSIPGDADTIEYMIVSGQTLYGMGASTANGASGYLTVKYSTAQDVYPGSGIEGGTNDVIENDCLTHNGDYGISAYCGGTGCNDSTLTSGPQNVTISYDEVSFNDQCNWEDLGSGFFPFTIPSACGGSGNTAGFGGCGCAGALKLWGVDGYTLDNDYIHDNYDNGIWADTDNNGGTIENDYISGNAGVGVDIEVSYNDLIEYDNFVNNGWLTAEEGGNIEGGIYISESGGSQYVTGNAGGINTITISTDDFANNWDGLSLWQSSDRFIGSANGNNASGVGTLGNENGGGSTGTFTGAWNLLTSDIPSTTYYVATSPTTSGCAGSGWASDGVVNGTTTVTSTCGFLTLLGTASPPLSGYHVFGTDIPTGDTISSCASAYSCTLVTAATGSATGLTIETDPASGGCGRTDLTGALPSGSPDYFDNCQWKAQNISVTGDTFSFNASQVGGCPTSWPSCGATVTSYTCATSGVDQCAVNGLTSQYASDPSWSPYVTLTPYVVADEITDCQGSNTFTGCTSSNNHFTSNTYTHTGSVNWAFWYLTLGNTVSTATWQTDGQDSGSTFS